MIIYIFKRLVSLVVTLLVATVVIFIMIEVVPGDPAAFMMGLSGGAEAANALRSELGIHLLTLPLRTAPGLRR